ncbi:MAG: type II toxin-antitoxin system VapC family toxin [Burkholderiales bacterium]
MKVVDASAVLELLLRGPRARDVDRLLLGQGEPLAAPHLVDLEVAQVLRRIASRGLLSEARAAEAFDDLAALPITRYDHLPLLPRIWALRGNLTAYDAAYLALAESLDAPLVTCDAALRAAPGRTVDVIVVA